MPDVSPVDRDARVYISGHHGLAGSAIWRTMTAAGFQNLFGTRSANIDLRDRKMAFDYLHDILPDVVVLAAARVGGIAANNAYPAEFLSDNLRIQVNVMDAAREFGVRRLVFLGSSCIYPKYAPQPIDETQLLNGALEPTNDAYAVAKIAGIMQVQAVRRQYGLGWISAMPTNLYGPGDNFDAERSHVLPAMIQRFHNAVERDLHEVVLWGSGHPRREFLHSDDLGRAILHLLDVYDDSQIVNVGVGEDIAIHELSSLVAAVVGFTGRISWDTSRPDGTPRKLLDITRIGQTGWAAGVGLLDGIRQTYEWFLEHVAHDPNEVNALGIS